MLRLSRERMLVALRPADLAWLCTGRRFGTGGTVPGTQRHLQFGQPDAAAGAPAWQAAVDALKTEAATWGDAPLDVTIVLSNAFVRYALVPATEGVSGGDELRALARFHFTRIHGAAAQGWEVRIGGGRSGRRGAPFLAAAVDAALMTALRELFRARARLASVQPALMAAYNAMRGQLPAAGGWLLMAEAERSCAALLGASDWRAVQNVRSPLGDAADCVHLLERERLRLPLPVQQKGRAAGDTATLREVLVLDLRSSAAPLSAAGSGSGGWGEWKPLLPELAWPAGATQARDGASRLALLALRA